MRAVTLDLWNTVIEDKDFTTPRVNCLIDALNRMNTPRSFDKIKKAYVDTHRYVHRIWKTENYRFVPNDERLGHILKELSAKLTEDLRTKVIKEFEEAAAADPPLLVGDAFDVLNRLSAKYRIGLISDSGMTSGRVLRRVLAGHGALRFFHATVFSDETGYNKPHKIMFERALSELGAEPLEAIHVGDLLHTDVAGAKAIGMKAVWLNRERKVNVGPFRPDYTIKSFGEIADVLSRIG